MERLTKNALFIALGPFVSVENAPSRNGYGKAPNQFIINFKNGKVLQSYDSIVAFIANGERFVTTKHDYSTTTSRFVGQFLGGMNLAARRKAIKNGELTRVDLVEQL